MASQVVPTYSIAAGKSEAPIIRELAGKYGEENISWPIILSNENEAVAYLYERNDKNKTNTSVDNRPISSSDLPSYFIDYTSSPRYISPGPDYLADFISDRYSCSYDYIFNSPFTTVDLDYVWKAKDGFKGFELTTFWMDFYSHERASELVSKMNRRPSWQGQNGAHALRKIVNCAEDLGIDYYFVCVNTVSKVGSDIKTAGNVYFFKLDHQQINRLSSGMPPDNSQFCSFEQFLSWL